MFYSLFKIKREIQYSWNTVNNHIYRSTHAQVPKKRAYKKKIKGV